MQAPAYIAGGSPWKLPESELGATMQFYETNRAAHGYSSQKRHMKTMTMETDTISRFKETQVVFTTLGSRAVPTWLPAPPVSRTRRTAKAQGKARKAERSIWITTEQETLVEKIMLTGLVFAAIIGVGYGFTSLLDCVQNWGAFNNWVAQIVH